MGRSKAQNRRKTLSKLKLMAKLEAGEDYTELCSLAPIVIIIVSVISGGLGVIFLSLFFFYLAAIQLYSGIGLNLAQWGWSWNRKVVAQHTKKQQPDLFYLNVLVCVGMGTVSTFFAAAVIGFLISH